MCILNKENTKEVEEYQEYIKSSKYGSFMQDLAWAKVKDNWKSEVIILKDKEKIIATMQVLIHSLCKTKYTIMYSPRGPVCDLRDIDTVNKLVEEAKLLAKKHNAIMLKIEPKVLYSKEIYNLYKKNKYRVVKNKSIFKNPIQPVYNMVVNIKEKDEEQILNSFASKTRYNVRYAYKKGVNCYYSNSEEDLKIFYELYKITVARDKIDKRPYEYFRKLLYSYKKNEIRIYIIKHENDYLAASIALNYAKEVYYIYGASSNYKRNLQPTYALMWEMIKWGIVTNCNTFNLGSVLVLNNKSGLYRFKVGFTKKEGIIQYIGEIEKIYKKGIYFVYNLILLFIRLKNKTIDGMKNK